MHSTADERAPIDNVREVAVTCPRGALFEVDEVDHRSTARDPRVIERVAAHLLA